MEHLIDCGSVFSLFIVDIEDFQTILMTLVSVLNRPCCIIEIFFTVIFFTGWLSRKLTLQSYSPSENTKHVFRNSFCRRHIIFLTCQPYPTVEIVFLSRSFILPIDDRPFYQTTLIFNTVFTNYILEFVFFSFRHSVARNFHPCS